MSGTFRVFAFSHSLPACVPRLLEGVLSAVSTHLREYPYSWGHLCSRKLTQSFTSIHSLRTTLCPAVMVGRLRRAALLGMTGPDLPQTAPLLAAQTQVRHLLTVILLCDHWCP